MKKSVLRILAALLAILLMTGCGSAVENTEPTKKVNFIGVNSAATETSPAMEETVQVQTEPISQTENIPESIEPEIPDDLPEYSVDDLLYDMANNALRAEVKYQDQYMLLTGKISGFDSDGAYFSLEGMYDNYDVWSGVMCNIESEDQLREIIEKNVDDVITIKCQVIEIGELIGYTVRVLEFTDMGYDSQSDYDTQYEEYGTEENIEIVYSDNDEHIEFMQGRFVTFQDDGTEIFVTVSAYREDYGEISYYLDYCTGGIELNDILYMYDECRGLGHSIMFDIGAYYPDYEGVVEILYDTDFGCSISAAVQNCNDTYGDYFELIPMS